MTDVVAGGAGGGGLYISLFSKKKTASTFYITFISVLASLEMRLFVFCELLSLGLGLFNFEQF